MPFSDYLGNRPVVDATRRMLAENRLPGTLLFAGPSGVGKATLARYLAAALNCKATEPDDFCGGCSSCLRILAADLSLPEYRQQADERAKMPAAKRGDSPLIVSTHPDFLIFPPDGPLAIIGVEQARALRAAARFNPSEGKHRIFVIDQADRANDEAANSLLKTLEEPAESLTLVLTAESPYELLPTIRSRCVPFYFTPLEPAEMETFFASREDFSSVDRERLASWSQGSPGRALALDVDEYLTRRETMLALLEVALDAGSFAGLIGRTEALARRTRERLEVFTEVLYGLLADLLHLRLGSGRLVNADIREDLRELAERVSLDWLEEATKRLEELDEFGRRNVQKQIALEALAIGLRERARTA